MRQESEDKKKLEEIKIVKEKKENEKRGCQPPWSAIPSTSAFSFSLSDKDKARRGY